MSLITRSEIQNVQELLDHFEFTESQIHNVIERIPKVRTNMNDTYTALVNGVEYDMSDIAIDQLLGIGRFAKRSFNDAQRVIIKSMSESEKLTAAVFMLNAAKSYADKDRYKLSLYHKSAQDMIITSITNPQHPSMDGVRVFRELFDKFGQLGLTPQVYDLTFDPITGRQSLEVVFEEFRKDTTITKNSKLGVGFKITNNTNGKGYFTLQIYAVQLVCSNGMIVPVRIGGLKIVHRSKWDMLKKFSSFINNQLNDYENFYDFTDRFYGRFVMAIVSRLKKHSHIITEALNRANTIVLPKPVKETFETLQEKYKTKISKKDVEDMISIYYSDPTIDRTTHTLANVVQSMTRHANSIESPSKREDLQELAYIVATA